MNGTDRKIMWCHWGINFSPFASIEGIGATYNFPPRGYGEWGTPSYELVCYSKNGIKLFPNDSSTLCLKRQPVPVTVTDLKFNSIRHKLYNRKLIIESTIYPVSFSIRNILGNIVLEGSNSYSSPIDLSNLNTSIYILSIGNGKEKLIDKILIN